MCCTLGFPPLSKQTKPRYCPYHTSEIFHQGPRDIYPVESSTLFISRTVFHLCSSSTFLPGIPNTSFSFLAVCLPLAEQHGAACEPHMIRNQVSPSTQAPYTSLLSHAGQGHPHPCGLQPRASQGVSSCAGRRWEGTSGDNPSKEEVGKNPGTSLAGLFRKKHGQTGRVGRSQASIC